MRWWVWLLVGVLGFVGLCEAQQLSDCDPIDPKRCLLPFPNDFWLKQNPNTPNQRSPRFGNGSFPVDVFGIVTSPKNWNDQLDGFQVAPAIVSFWEDLSLDNIPDHHDIQQSLDAACASTILDATTLERIPHWGELDFSTNHTTDRLLMLWPSRRLESGRRYIVALRNLHPRSSSAPYEPSVAFRALRDRLNSTDPDVYLRRQHFEDIFATLAKAGIARDSLQLAWDFTTGSRESLTGRLIFMRDDGLSRLPNDGPDFKIIQTTENPSNFTRRLVQGIMKVPLYLTSSLPGSTLVLDKNGKPQFQGFADATFAVQIPASLVRNKTTGGFIQYGHGLLGSQLEIKVKYLQEIGDEFGYITAACDWWGLAQEDEATVSVMIATDLALFPMVPDRCQQGILNQMVLTRLLRSKRFATSSAMCPDGQCVLDGTRGYYDGNSEGGILGAALLGVSPDLLRGVLGVGGAPYGLLLPRSADFSTFFDILKTRFLDPIDRVNVINIFQMLWDRGEPSAYMDSITSNPLPNTPVKQVLLHYGLGDAQVSWLGCHTLSRSLNAVMFPNNVQEDEETFFGFPVVDVNVTKGAVVVGFNFGAPTAPQINVPPQKSTDTHECTRRDPRGQQQLHTFFQTGVIVDVCAGQGCNPIQPPIHLDACPLPDFR